MSLKDQKQKDDVRQGTESLYPSASANAAGGATEKQPQKRTLKALYDFEAAEDNELTFKAGELIALIDDRSAVPAV